MSEARGRLAQRGHPRDEIEKTVERALAEGLLDDRLFTKLWIEDCLHSRPLSRRAVQIELSNRGIRAELIAELLDALYPAEREAPLALQLACDRFSKLIGVEDERRLRRVVAYLGRRGFSKGLAIQAAKAARLRSVAEDDDHEP